MDMEVEIKNAVSTALIALVCACGSGGNDTAETDAETQSGASETPAKEESADAFCSVTQKCEANPAHPSEEDCYNFYVSMDRGEVCQPITNLLMTCIGSLSCDELELYSSKGEGYPCSVELQNAEPCGW